MILPFLKKSASLINACWCKIVAKIAFYRLFPCFGINFEMDSLRKPPPEGGGSIVKNQVELCLKKEDLNRFLNGLFLVQKRRFSLTFCHFYALFRKVNMKYIYAFWPSWGRLHTSHVSFDVWKKIRKKLATGIRTLCLWIWARRDTATPRRLTNDVLLV